MRTAGCLRLSFGVYLLALSAAAAAQNAVTTHPVSVYSGPDDSYPMVAQLDADAPIQVMGCLNDWSWCDVAFADNRGWLYAPDITYDYEGGYVPLYTYAPSLGVPVVEFTIGDYWGRYYHGRSWYAQRDEWEHRGPAHHRRPPGPPPSAGPPPRSARVERPPHEAQSERRMRLGTTEPPNHDAERHDGARDNGAARPPTPVPAPRPAEHVAPPDPSHESHARPAERAGPQSQQERQPSRAEPPRHEEHALPPQRAEGARHEDTRHDETRHEEKPGDRPGDSPH
jgi:uncharacterized protein YraI